MSLVFAGFVPHPPTLHETIGKEHAQELGNTHDAFALLRDELYVTRPDVLMIITPHGREHEHAFEVMGHPLMQIDLSFFGDLVTHAEYKNDVQLVTRIREAADRQKIPVRLDGRKSCDYGSSIPLLALDNEVRSIVIIRTAHLNAKAHLDFGYLLKDIIMHETKRIAIIATGDLEHAAHPQPISKKTEDAHTFDEIMTDILASGHLSRLMNMDQKTIQRAATCAYEPLLMLAGILARVKTHPHILAYDRPHGVGYLTVHFALH